MMNKEDERLKTFEKWPQDAVVGKDKLAKAGFYYLGDKSEVKCFFCNLIITHWEYGDKVMSKHRLLSPSCDFVKNPLNCNNTPILDGYSSDRKVQLTDITKYNDLRTRIESFKEINKFQHINMEEYACAGFFYCALHNRIRCAFCGTFCDYNSDKNPYDFHRLISPTCPYIQNLSANNDSEVKEKQTDVGYSSFNKETDILSRRIPKYEHYAAHDIRSKSYESFKSRFLISVDLLADAGFYYSGNNDQVCCFHCGGRLGNWNWTDDPWIEHAKFFPECDFLILMKGEDFIKAAKTGEISIRYFVEMKMRKFLFQEYLQSRCNELNIDEMVLKFKYSLFGQTFDTLNELISYCCFQMLQIEDLEATNEDVLDRALIIQLQKGLEVYNENGCRLNPCVPLDLPQLNLEKNHSEGNEPATPCSFASRYDVNNGSSLISSSRTVNCRNASKESNGGNVVTECSVATNNNLSRQREKLSNHLFPNDEAELWKENRKLKEARLCVVCMDEEINVMFVPCGHLVACSKCAVGVEQCPMCRDHIHRSYRVFLP